MFMLSAVYQRAYIDGFTVVFYDLLSYQHL